MNQTENTIYVCDLRWLYHYIKNFEGPVFVFTILMQQTKQMARDEDSKCISFGMDGLNIMNTYSTLKNDECQLYFFYGYFTDYVYHGVP